MSPQRNGHRPVTRFGFDDDDVIVVVGSGAGGGTLANELCQKGAKVVLLEAGAHHQPEDFVNDEWPSFNQLAWLDERTTSGSWRIAKDFPNLPGVDLQGRRRHHRALGRLLPALQGVGVPRPLRARRDRRHQRCSTGRSASRTSSPTTTRPRTGWASPARTGSRRRPPTTTSR